MQAIKDAVFGTSEPKAGEEPVSGTTGTGTASEPYDGGNVAGQSGAPAETATGTNLRGTTDSTTGTSTDATSNTLGDASASNTEKSTTDTAERLAPDTSTTGAAESTGTSSTLADNPASTNEGPYSSETANKADPRVDSDKDNSATLPPTSSTDTSDETPTTSTGAPATDPDPIAPSQAPAANTSTPSDNAPGGVSSTGAVQPSVDSEPTLGKDAGVKNEGADNPLDEPSKMEDVTEGSAGMNKADEAVGSTGGGDVTAPKPKEEKNDTPGTGEKWVKTTGVAAEGGDFDATKPGAGREADRLMEQAGIEKTQPGKPSEPSSSTAGSTAKVSKIDKIKEKLHIGKK